jgi:hypothetical protein
MSGFRCNTCSARVTAIMRRPLRHIVPVAVAASALGIAGCVPLVQNEAASQQDLVGAVKVSADVCESPNALGVVVPLGRSARRAAGELRRVLTGRVARPAGLYSCPSTDELDDYGPQSEFPHQMLLAYRVPAGATAPATITTTVQVLESDPVIFRGAPAEPETITKTVTFRRFPGLDDKVAPGLAAVTPDEVRQEASFLRDGQKVVGYASDPVDGVTVGQFKVDAEFGLPAGTADQPYAGPFNTLTAIGSRAVLSDERWEQIGADVEDDFDRSTYRSRGLVPVHESPQHPNPLSDDRDVTCLDPDVLAEIISGPETFEAVTTLYGLAFCPAPSMKALEDADGSDELPAAYAKAMKGIDLQTRDLRVLGGEGFAEPGTMASVPFTFRTAGAAGDTQLGLSAATALTGASAAPQAATTTFPAAGDTAKPVTVQVPADAAPGTYAVTLTAKVGGQSRTGTGHVVVVPKAVQTPSQSHRDNVYMDRDGNIAFGWICPPACGNDQVDVTAPKAGISPKANTAAVTKPRLLRIARGKFKANPGQRARVKVKLYSRARRAVRRGRVVKAIIIVRQGGKGTPIVRRVVVRRKAG